MESIYQVCATVAYCVGLGSTTAPAVYLRDFIGPLTVFVSMNFGAYLFGGLIALTDLLCLNEAQSLQQPQVTENSQGAEEK
ncbi:unnamed protein product [Dicrocoelium dendriticum]|nr:unnamed protein product [Dicrocoelium dendriticum]